MSVALRDILSLLFDIVAPPRASELLVRGLAPTHLRSLALRGEKSGSLPYRDERVRALVWEIKYHANKRAAELAGAVLADILAGIASEELGKPLLIPVPMHPKRRRERGHNQTEVLCTAALSYMDMFYDYVPGALERIAHTRQQQGLEKHERLQNIQGTMKADAKIVRGRVCIVVDDVSTTGATFAEATRALKASGASRVECIALAYS